MERPKVILLVENDIEYQALFMEAIGEIENASLIGITNNGRQALNRLNNHLRLPDIIFMDIDMPVMNGLECLAEIIKTPELRHIPVVILSNDGLQADFLYRLGAKALIKKLTGLTDKPLDDFMKRYRPSYMFAMTASDYEFGEYIKLAYAEFRGR